MKKIGVAISGGGHRASLFGLGVLLYLADAGKLGQVSSVSSVSGGSLTNAFLAQSGNIRRMSRDEFRSIARRFAQQLARRGTLWAWPGTWLYLAVLALVPLLSAAVFVLPIHMTFRWVLFLTSLVMWAWWIVGRRGLVCGRAFAATLSSSKGRRTRLKDIAHEGIDHVICATDLHAGEHVYFSGNFVCSYRFGWGRPGNLFLDEAVQASAAFPGGFPPRWLRTTRHQFQDGTEQARHLVLSDGGVYDNMAEQWAIGLSARKRRWPHLASELQTIDELIIVNGSAGMDWQPIWALRLPVIGELVSLLRIVNVLYDNTTTSRRRLLVQSFDRAAKEQQGITGALTTIEQSPFHLAEQFIQSTDFPERSSRAQEVLDYLGRETKAGWEQIVNDNCSVATTLRSLGICTSAQLIRHGYLVAMCNLHVVLGYPLHECPDKSSFEAFCG